MGAMDLVRAKDRGSSSSSPCENVDASASESNRKCCVDCKATKTPLWRSGPAGPKSLCNACGIRYRKRRTSSGSNKEPEKNKKEIASEAQDQAQVIDDANGGSTEEEREVPLSESMKTNLAALAKKRRRYRSWRKLGEDEEEQAGVSLGHVLWLCFCLKKRKM